MSARNPWSDRRAERLERRISLESDGTVVAYSGKVEYGQGIRTAFATIIAEELDLPIEHVRVELGERPTACRGTWARLAVCRWRPTATRCARRLHSHGRS
jgi:CO/xanthine dehydrogenase Mo-binding subunit